MTVQDLLRARARDLEVRGQVVTAQSLADSLSVENFRQGLEQAMPLGSGGKIYRATTAFRHLRQDARVAAARRALAGRRQ